MASEKAASRSRKAREVEITTTPLTNTLPIRRLRLPIGGNADIVTAYVSESEHLYVSRGSDFRRTIMVDKNG